MQSAAAAARPSAPARRARLPPRSRPCRLRAPLPRCCMSMGRGWDRFAGPLWKRLRKGRKRRRKLCGSSFSQHTKRRSSTSSAASIAQRGSDWPDSRVCGVVPARGRVSGARAACNGSRGRSPSDTTGLQDLPQAALNLVDSNSTRCPLSVPVACCRNPPRSPQPPLFEDRLKADWGDLSHGDALWLAGGWCGFARRPRGRRRR